MDQVKDGKVIPFRNDYAVINPTLRKRLEESIKDHTEKPKETVDTFESVICTYIIATLRQVATTWGRRAGGTFARKVVGD